MKWSIDYMHFNKTSASIQRRIVKLSVTRAQTEEYKFMTYRMSFLLNFQDRSILKGPFNHIGIRGDSLDSLGGFKSRPEGAEALELDQMPDIAELGFDDGRLSDRSGGWNLGRHYVLFSISQVLYSVNSILVCCVFVWKKMKDGMKELF